MLRPLKTAQPGCRIIPLTITHAVAGATIDFGLDDVALAASATGVTDITFRRPFQRAPIILGCAHTLAYRAGGTRDTNTTLAKARLTLNDDNTGSGNAVDGTADYLIVGWDHSTTEDWSVTKAGDWPPAKFDVRGALNNGRLVAFYVDESALSTSAQSSDGILHGEYDVTGMKNDTGDYTFVFNPAFGSVPFVFATCLSAATASVTTKAANTITIKTANGAGAAANADFNVFVYGSNGMHRVGGNNSIVMQSQRMARLQAHQLTGEVAGVTHQIGDSQSTAARTGAGVFTLTPDTIFNTSRMPLVVANTCDATPAGAFPSQSTVGTTSVTTLTMRNAAGTATDSLNANILIVGYDNVDKH